MQTTPVYITALLCLVFSFSAIGQRSDTSLAFEKVFSKQNTDSGTQKISPQFINDVSRQATDIEDKLDNDTRRVLDRMQQQEQKMLSKLAKVDSIKANELVVEAKAKYEAFHQQLQRKTTMLKQYIPSLDSLGSSVAFLKDNPELLKNAIEIKDKLEKTSRQLKSLQEQFQKAEDVKRFIQQRKQYFQDQLRNLGFVRQLKKLNKEVYYYSIQVNEYKELLKDQTKATKKALELLGKTALFKDFMRKHSQLASLFSIPDPTNPSIAATLQGLQSREQITNLIQGQLAAGGPGAQAQFSQNLQGAQGQLNELKNKLLESMPGGGNSSEDIMPEGFRPNDQKTKSFWKRIELGSNIQSQKGNGLLPVTSDIGLNVGYKLHYRSVIGVGASYKVGWGESIRKIKVSHQGLGMRSFVDMKLKGSFWITGGYEMNYRSEFKNIDVLRDMNAWQRSGLVGLSKIVSVKTNLFKKTKLQLLWDFMSYEQVPRTQPVVFRMGYIF